MATVSYLYRSTKDIAPLNLRLLFRHNSKDLVIGAKTKLDVEKGYYPKLHNQSRNVDAELRNKQLEIKAELNKITSHVLKAFNTVDPEKANKDWLQLQIEYYYNPPQKEKRVPVNLVDFIDYYIDKRKNEVKPASITKFKVIKHKLERMELQRKQPINIIDVNDNFKVEFVRFYQSESYSQNTTQRELGIVKTFCKYAKTKGVETHPEMDGLNIKKGEAIKIYLNFDEIEKIENLKGLPEHLEGAKDWLIISCFTGQRISDFMKFNKEMIREEDGKKLIEFTQQKTGKIMTVPLHTKVLEILEKRNGEFPRKFSDQRYNDHIKTVAKKAGLNEKIEGKKQLSISETESIIRNVVGTYYKYELITSHIGRRSFATNFYGKIPTTYLIYVTGHSTEAMFLNYISKSNKDLAMELTKYF